MSAADAAARWGQRLSTAVVLFHEAVGETLGVSAADHRALTLISAYSSVSAGTLARLTGLTPGAVTGLVERLERAGLVSRTPDADDRRRILIEPTGETSAEARAAFARLGAAMGEVMARYDQAQLETIADYVSRTIDVLDEQTRLLGASRARSDDPSKGDP